MGKAIYQPKGKAQEYNPWAVNFYNGCRGNCTYCYNKKGRSAKLLGKIEPTLKKSLVNPDEAIQIFEKEVIANLKPLREYGLLFNFVSDPFLPETIELTKRAINVCNKYYVKCIYLTKQAGFINDNDLLQSIFENKHTVGFTLTGHDEQEPGCSTNDSRIDANKWLNEIGVTTWASIEPIIDFQTSLLMIKECLGGCNHFKIGLESGKKYDRQELADFVMIVNDIIERENREWGDNITIYWKESILKALGQGKHDKYVFAQSFSVDADYKFWK